MRVKCLAQEHNTMTQPGLKPRPLDLEPGALTTRPPHLPYKFVEMLDMMLSIKRIYPFHSQDLKAKYISLLVIPENLVL